MLLIRKCFSCCWVWILLPFVLATHCEKPEVPYESADVALYADRGADEDCLQASENMFRWMGCTVALVDANHVKNVGLDNFRILCVPGGDMYQYAQDLSSSGIETMRSFIDDGGGYIGICAGAYFASERVIWRGSQLPMVSLGLLPGSASGPVDEIIPYPDYGMCKVNIVDATHCITQSEPDSAWMLYYWGPVLLPNGGVDASILAEYEIVREPMMIALNYGEGRVFLIGSHPEFEEDSNRDGVDFADEFDDRGSDWELMKNAVLWCLKESGKRQ